MLTASEGLLTPDQTLYHDPTAEGVGARIIWFRDTDIRAHIQHRFGGGYAALVRYEDLEIHEDFDPGELETALAWIRDGLDWVYEQIQEPEC